MDDKEALWARLKEADAKDLTAFTVQLCREYTQRWPDQGGVVWLIYGIRLVELARYSEAEAALKKALEQAPDGKKRIPEAQMGHLELARGNKEAARAWFLKAHKAKPDDASYPIYIANTYFRDGHHKSAEEWARKATQCSKGCVDEAYLNLGSALIAQERFEEARECYKRALELDPDYELAKKGLADVECVISDI